MRRGAALVIAVGACGRVGFGDRGATLDAVVEDGSLDDARPDLPGLVVRFSFEDGPNPTTDPISGLTATCDVPACPQPSAGRRGQALQFDGVDDCLRVQAAAVLLRQQFTIALWARQASTGPMTSVSQPHPAGGVFDNSWELEAGFNLDFTFTINHAGTLDEIGTISGLIALDTWYHLAASWDGARQRIFVDGSLRQDVAYAGAIPYDSTPMFIGCDDNAGTYQPFAGMIDEVELYDRALSPAEVAQRATE
jgi:hypothetical protein